MKHSMILSAVIFLVLSFAARGADEAGPYTTATGKKVYEQLSSDVRSDEERRRDVNRRPVETLEFFGLEDDMTVVELLPGGGWYTKILAPVLQEKGKLYLAMGTGRLQDEVKALGAAGMFAETGTMEGFAQTDAPGYIFDIASLDLGLADVDMVLTFRNLHNLSADARRRTNEAVFKALKPRGIYGVIDHSKRHMQPFAAATWRRIDPVIIIKEALDAGFEFVAFSDLHARAEDTLEFDSRHESLPRESDRFTLKFRKP